MLARVLSLFWLMPLALWAQDLDAQLEALSGRIEALEARGAGEAPDLEALSALALELEGLLGEMRQIERANDEQQRVVEEKFYAESRELMALIGFIATVQSQPAPDYVLHPEGALASVEANIILESLYEQLENGLDDIGRDLRVWREANARKEALQSATEEAFADVNDLREDIVRAQNADLPVGETAEPMVLDALYAVSESLDDFVDGLGQIEMLNVPDGAGVMAAEKGKLPWPVQGEAVKKRQGVEILTEDRFVLAPISGTVRFNAVFLDYGHTVILEPEKDYLIVLAGMDQSAVEEGDLVKKGDVIGFFDADSSNNEENASSSLRMPEKSLYVETRYKTEIVPVGDYFSKEEN